MSPLGEYQSDIPQAVDNGSEADVREEMGKISQKDTVEYTQDLVDQKLGDPGFFGFVQATAEGADGTGNIQDFLEEKSPEAIAQLAELYDTKVKPVTERLTKFIGTELLEKKMKVLKGANLDTAKESISSFLGKEAARNPDAFTSKYLELFNKYDTLDAKVKSKEAELKEKYKKFKTTDPQKLAKVAAEAELRADRGTQAQVDNVKERVKQQGEIGQQKFNGLNKFKNRVLSLGREKRSDAEIDEDQSFHASQEAMGRSIEAMRTLSVNIKNDLKDKADLDGQIDSTRTELLGSLTESEEIRQIMVDATLSATTDPGGFDAGEAASSLDAMGEIWEKGKNTEIDDLMTNMLSNTYKQAIESSLAGTESAKSLDKTKMAQFDSFLKSNMHSPQAREMMATVIEEKFKDLPEADRKTPKGAQLARMKSRVTAMAAA